MLLLEGFCIPEGSLNSDSIPRNLVLTHNDEKTVLRYLQDNIFKARNVTGYSQDLASNVFHQISLTLVADAMLLSPSDLYWDLDTTHTILITNNCPTWTSCNYVTG